MAGNASEWGIAALAALATVGSSYLVIRAQHRDRSEDRISKIEEKFNDHDGRLIRLEEFREWVNRTFKFK